MGYESKGNVPIPPPPPIAPSLVKPLHVETNNQRRSTSPGSSYYSPGGSTPLVPETRGPPPPVQPAGDQLDGYRRSVDRERLNSVSTHQTEKTERYELEESSEFLQPIVDEKGPTSWTNSTTKLSRRSRLSIIPLSPQHTSPT